MTWAYYAQKGTGLVDSDEGTTPTIWNPLPYFVDVNQDGQVANVQDSLAFFQAAAAGSLPAVSWVTPNAEDSEHPPALVSSGQAWVTSLINAVMQGPDWNTSAIFVSWDDWGGFYDHVVPPKVDQNGYGLRVPGLLISPYSKSGFVDPQVLSFDAYNRFIEEDFLNGQPIDPKTDGRPDPRLDVREAAAQLGDLTAEFDFSQTPRPPLVLPLFPTMLYPSPGGPYSIQEGQSLTLDGAASASPQGYPLSYTWTAAGLANFSANGVNPTLTWSQLSSMGLRADPGSYRISVLVTDGNGHMASSDETLLTVMADPPNVSINGPSQTDVGAAYTLNLSGTYSGDPDKDTINSWMITWGDGTTTTVSGNPSSITHIFLQPGSSAVSALANDDDGAYPSLLSGGVTILAASLNLSGDFTIQAAEGTDTGAQTVATFTDPNGPAPLSDYSALISWGDGASSAGSITFNSGSGMFTVRGSHTYAEQGTPTITVTVNHALVAAATITSSATIRARSDIAGWVQQSGDWWVGASNGSTGFTNTRWGSWDPTVTWVDVLAGDFNGDGRTDYVGRQLQTGQVWVALSNGSTFTTTQWTTWDPNVTWADVRVGNFSGHANGMDDIAGRVLQSGDWWVGVSNGTSFTNQFWTHWYPGVTWTDVKVGDFTGGGKADIAGRVLQSGDWWVAQSTGSSFTNSWWTMWYPNVTWVDVQVGDFNGDGKADLAGRVLQSGDWWVAQSTGSSFTNSFWGHWSPAVTWVDVKVGDFNGDSKTDLVGRVLESGDWWVAQSTGSSFTNSFWGNWSPSATWVDVQVGDFNGDGNTDIAGRNLADGAWWVGLSNGSTGFDTTLWTIWNPGVNWVDVHTGDFT